LACIAIYTKFRLKAAGGGCNLEIEKEREREKGGGLSLVVLGCFERDREWGGFEFFWRP